MLNKKKKEKIHNLEESSASEGPSKKEDDNTKCKSLFQKY